MNDERPEISPFLERVLRALREIQETGRTAELLDIEDGRGEKKPTRH